MEKKRDSFFLSSMKQKSSAVKKESTTENTKQKKEKEFDKNRPEVSELMENGKKPFDKKAYRFKKYSKKYKLEQWEEQRRKKLLHEYHKNVKDNPIAGIYKPKSFDEDTPDSVQIGRFVKHPDLLEKELRKTIQEPLSKAKVQFNKVKEEKLQKQRDKEVAREERMQKLQEYKKKKQDRFKKLSKKNKKGQPVMSSRMELLLEKIKTFN